MTGTEGAMSFSLGFRPAGRMNINQFSIDVAR